jgi:Zn-finger nucleic acid-binding protein
MQAWQLVAPSLTVLVGRPISLSAQAKRNSLMKCPIDATELVMTERHGVEIDYCPKCRGVWLDRGELDKIIDKAVPPIVQEEPRRASTVEPGYTEAYRDEEPQQRKSFQDEQRAREYRPRESNEQHYSRQYSPKKRKSLLAEIFDFD